MDRVRADKAAMADQAPEWTSERVLARLIEAAEVIARSSARPGPRGYVSAWPETLPEADIRGLLKATGNAPAGNRRSPPSAAALSRAHETFDWWPLIADEERRRQLQFRVLAWASGLKWSAVCRQMNWKRKTVDSRIAVELARFAGHLAVKGIAAREPDARHVAKAEKLLGAKSGGRSADASVSARIEGEPPGKSPPGSVVREGSIRAIPAAERGAFNPGIIRLYSRSADDRERERRRRLAMVEAAPEGGTDD